MCGIAGSIGLGIGAQPDPRVVRAMAEHIEHRGPDGFGLWTSECKTACFAHQRLSVIDIELGHQPMVDSHGSAALVFNGEIYNYLELRTELESRGVRFRTRSDTEVLLELLKAKGVDGLQDTIGMFAFAYWDGQSRNFILARDRLGKKPLFYTVQESCLYFCSSLRGLEAALPSQPQISTSSLLDFIEVGYIPAPATVYDGVRKLTAGTAIVSTGQHETPEPKRFWSAGMRWAEDGSPDDEIDQLNALLEDAVRLRLRSDVPLGVFLSGGVDSSLVTALAQKLSTEKIKTFTIGFDIPEFDESSRARRIARHLGTVHKEFVLQADLLALLPRVMEHFGEPFADSAALPLWHLAEQARDDVVVALLGDGGDEAFSGYPWYRASARLDTLHRVLGRLTPPVTSVARRAFGRRGRRLAHLMGLPPSERFAEFRRTCGPWAAPRFLNSAFVQEARSRGSIVFRLSDLYRDERAPENFRMQFADVETYLADGLLPKVDVATMAHGLEARAPLLDHRVLDFAFSLHPHLNSPRNPKALLRELLSRHVDPSLFAGPKRGFTVPLRNWFQNELRAEVETLATGPLADAEIVDPVGLGELIDSHMADERDHSERIFHLIVLSRWLEG